MSDWNYSVVGGQNRWTITLPGEVDLRIYHNHGGPYHWHVAVGEHVVDSDYAEHLPVAKRTACEALIVYAQKLLDAARNIDE